MEGRKRRRWRKWGQWRGRGWQGVVRFVGVLFYQSGATKIEFVFGLWTRENSRTRYANQKRQTRHMTTQGFFSSFYELKTHGFLGVTLN